MANRVLRDWTTSEKIDQLSLTAEVFFTRLIMKADDHGCFHANIKLLKAALFPLKDVSLKDVDKWLKECERVGILQTYKVENREYLKIYEFNQRLRNMVSKFPQPDDNARPIGSNKPPETKRNETESEVETEVEFEVAEATVSVWPSFDDFWDKYGKKVNKPKSLELWKKISQGAREKIMQHLEMYTQKEKQYRKDPERYLRHEVWNDEIILTPQTNGTRTIDKREQGLNSLKENFAKRVVARNAGESV